MKTLLLALALLPYSAFAGTLNCVDERVSYSADHTDGGAPREPIVRLELDGQLLIKTGQFQEPIQNAQIEFLGEPTVIKKIRRDRQHEVIYQEREARITIENVDPVPYTGTLLCKEVRYVGPPRP